MMKRETLYCQQYEKDLLMIDKTEDGFTELLIFCDESRLISGVKLSHKQIEHLIEVLRKNNEGIIN